jgi:7-carboxy-7-deazaguanine synthase
MRVNEIFWSLQGEGVNSGLPTMFIRLQGCNLHCDWCDTKYALTKTGGEELTPEQIMEKVLNVKTLPMNKRWACITGGEPLTQSRELRKLVSHLVANFYYTEIETNGSKHRPRWYRDVECWVTDMKCPSSGWTTPAELIEEWFAGREQDCVKFVVANEADLAYVKAVLLHYKPPIPQVIVSPVISLGASVLQEQTWLRYVWEFCLTSNLRFSLQTHKVVFGNRKGV